MSGAFDKWRSTFTSKHGYLSVYNHGVRHAAGKKFSNEKREKQEYWRNENPKIVFL